MILSVNNIDKSFGVNRILNDVSFQINDNEKAAIVGPNGAGKSTLFKIIIGEIDSDGGSVTMARDCKVGYLAQHELVDSNNTVYEEMLSVKADVIELEKSIRNLEIEMKNTSGKELERMLENYSKLTHEFEYNNGYAYKSEVVGVLKGLGFYEDTFDNMIDNLSGGEKTRIALGKLLLSNPDLLLLDEPTNHLDLETITWLENYLASYKGAVVLISHDRYFLDKIVSKIIDLENTKASVYNGNYSSYAIKKSRQHEAKLKQFINQQEEIKRQEQVIEKLRSFNREKSLKRAKSREKALEKVELIDKPYDFDDTMSIRFEPSIKSGNDVLTVEGLSKSYNNVTLFEDLDFEIKRGEHVAIIGNNGTGKSTILKIINRLEKPDDGFVKLGEKVHIAYHDQEQEMFNMENTVFDEIHDAYPYLNNTAVRNVLASFLFTGDDVFKQMKDLSGGERGRVSLAKLMLSEANFLILDEPTNHLDITSKEVLENAINKYQGTVLYVSHDRYFINKTATRILDLTNNTMINYLGNYDYYLEKKPELEKNLLPHRQIDKPSSNLSNKTKVNTSSSGGQESSEALNGKLGWLQHKEEQANKRRVQNELKETEEKIASFEKRNEEIDALLVEEDIYTNVEKLVELNNEKEQINKNLESLLEKWEKLASYDFD